MNVLVTGGAGYVGSHACKALARAGYHPIVFDNLSTGHSWAVKWGPLELGDVLDRAALDRTIGKHRPGACLHFAALAYVGESVLRPGQYYRNNLVGSLVLIEAMRDHGIRNFVFSSSCAVYGMPYKQAPIDETVTQAPINPYGMSKLVTEHMLADFCVAHGLRSAALRYFNAAGADPDGEVGEEHDPETHLVPLALNAARGDGEAIRIFGSDYQTPDGTCIRDYVHVADLADAHVRALKALEAGMECRAFNLGNGRGFSVWEIIRAVERVTGGHVPVNLAQRRPGDPPWLISDPSRAIAELGWRPRITWLDEIISTAWEWQKQRAATRAGATALNP